MQYLIAFFICLTGTVFALDEAPVRKLQDQPIEEVSQNRILITCPEIVKFKLLIPASWVSNPCAAKFKGMTPNAQGGPRDLVQCYYTYICGGGDYTIEKRFSGFSCAPKGDRQVVCTTDP
ncbi:MAG: hypothetical protein AABY86_17420 [Bdellovibrionota bacterium]